MTRIFIATVENLRRELGTFDGTPTKALLFAVTFLRSTCHAATWVRGDYPVFVYQLEERDTLRVLGHEELHRALLKIGEMDATRALDRAENREAIEDHKCDVEYRVLHGFFKRLAGGA